MSCRSSCFHSCGICLQNRKAQALAAAYRCISANLAAGCEGTAGWHTALLQFQIRLAWFLSLGSWRTLLISEMREEVC